MWFDSPYLSFTAAGLHVAKRFLDTNVNGLSRQLLYMRLLRFLPLILPLWIVLMPCEAQAQAPIANFDVKSNSDTSGCEPFPLLVEFDNQSANATSYQWFFGDPANSQSQQFEPLFTYSDANCYDVTLVAINSFGTDTITRTCFIEILPQPIPSLVFDVQSGCAPLTVNVTDTSVPNAPSITNWTYIFSDGTNSNAPNPTLTFTTPDSLDLAFSVTNSFGCKAVETYENIINVAQPAQLDFEVDTSSACNPPLIVNFTNLSQASGAASPVYNWQFPGGTLPGGGSTFTGFTPPPVAYNNDGVYDVSLSLTTTTPQCDTATTVNSVVGIGGVDASFTSSAQVVCIGQEITFQATSAGGVTLHQWDFGEVPGIDTAGNVVSYAYGQPGTYTVTLFAENTECGDTIEQVNFITVEPRPVADFTIDRDFDCQPSIPFNFTDQSVDAVAWDWDFGDGATANAQNPSHAYTNFGAYEVCLIVTNAQGCQDTLCDSVMIDRPDVDFSATPREGCIPLQVEFTDLSDNPGDPVISWEWAFPGAIPPTVTMNDNPTVLYTSLGTFPVTLIIETASGCTDTLTRNNYIRAGTLPVNGFTVDEDTVCVLEGLTFTADSANADWNYYWDFQYAAPGAFNLLDTMPATVYPDTGVFSVALIIDNTGCRDTLIRQDLIYVSPPRADFTVDGTLLCGLPATVNITDNSTGPADVIEWYVNGSLYSTAQTPPPLTMTTPNTYQIRQVLFNTATGCTDTADVSVLAGDPQADFASTVLSGCRPLEVPFTNNSLNFGSSSWDFSIGGSTQNDPSFTFPDTGFYDVTLTVSDAFGCQSSLTRTNYIEVIGPYAAFEGDPRTACPGTVIQFTDTSNSFGSTINRWAWNFGDTTSTSNISSLPNPTHSYLSAGVYPVTLVVEDNEGCTDTLRQSDYISITFPEPSFTVDDSSTCAGNDLQFTNTSQGFGLSYVWLFGNGDSSTQVSPTYAYADTGFFDLRLVATDQNGCVDTLFRPGAIYIEPFEADFEGTPRTGLCPPLSSQFTNLTVGNDTAWQWNFGSFLGTGSTEENPGHFYLEAGQFDVTLIATHEDGCRDTVIKEDYIDIGGPSGTYTLAPDEICLGDSICLTAVFESAASLAVDFRDGTVRQQSGLPSASDTLTFCHLYQSADTLSPILIVTDSSGCTVFYRNRDTVVVHPRPQANILPQDTVGCAPLPVSFLDATVEGDTAIIGWLWDFGDGDSSTQANPTHTFIGDTTYTVTLEVEDGYGCRDTAQTTATPQDGAIPEFAALDTTGCAPFLAEFSDLSTNVTPNFWLWAFGDGDSLEGVTNPDHIYLNDGTYTVTLIVGDSLGCRDTLVKEDYIVLDHPEAALRVTSQQVCNPATVVFYGDSSTGTFPLTTYSWELINLTTGDTVQLVTQAPEDSVSLEFEEPAEFEMRLTVLDEEGCSDVSEPVAVSVVKRTTPAPLAVRNVSVLARNQAEIIWERYPNGDFQSYAIYRIGPGGSQPVGSVTDQDSTRFVDSGLALDLEANSYCYKVLAQNTCDEFSELALTEAHCTIELRASPAPNAIRLNWSAYVGYQVSEYEVYRVADYDSASALRIAVVSGNTLTFLDEETFCRDSVSYRVRGIGAADSIQRTWSDVSASDPDYILPTENTDIITATVVDDTVVNVSWAPYTGYKPANYLLERSEDNGATWQALDTTGLSTLAFTDPNVLVDEQSYRYRVFTVDSCGDISQEGFYGETILLRAELGSRGDPVLNWSPYAEWPNGVLTYQVEVFNESTQNWEEVGLTNRRETTFEDRETSLNQVSYCYRIQATEAGGRGATSLSNEACLTFGPRIYVPNAFTPNRDGKNDTFTIFAPNVRNAEIWIYNRWGNLVYYSDNLEEGWDGNYQGRPVPEGVYVYRLRAQGFEGSDLEQSGSVTLIR